MSKKESHKYKNILHRISNRNVMLRLIISLILFSSCQSYVRTTPERALNPILRKCVSNDTSVIYRLDTILDFEWDRLIILTPYFNRIAMKDCGIKSDIPSSVLDNNDGVPLEYLFIKDAEVHTYLVHDKGDSKIILTLDPYYNFNHATNPLCGITNQPNTYIRLIPNADKGWSGRTYYIFHKN